MAENFKIIKNDNSENPSWTYVKLEYVDGKNIQTRVPRKDAKSYELLGFPLSMSFKEAKAREAKIKAEAQLVKIQKLKENFEAKNKELRVFAEAYISDAELDRFETEVLAPKFENATQLKPRHKITMVWRSSLRIIEEVKLSPELWNQNYFKIVRAAMTFHFGGDYFARIIGLMNEYGYWYCLKERKAFLPMRKLRGAQLQKLNENARKKPGKLKASAPLSLELLLDYKKYFTEKEFNWLMWAVCFGLRPNEADAVGSNNKHSPHVIIEGGITALKVYQSKLVSKREEERWKLVPCLLPIQKELIKTLSKTKVERPKNKKLKDLLPGITAYGPRKNFASWLLDEGYTIETVAAAMGHTDVKITWRVYRNRNRIIAKKIA